MSDDLEQKLRERLGLGAPEQKPLLGTGDAQNTELAINDNSTMMQRLTQEQAAPLIAYLVFDTTGSMRSIIKAVRECIKQIGNELLGAGQSIEAVILGAGDHYDKDRLQRENVRMLGDYGQDNEPTTNPLLLQQQIDKIIITSGDDEPEAYECLAADLSLKIQQDKANFPQKKQVVAFFGDAKPHDIDDKVCPLKRGPEQLLVLAAMADHTYFIDCQEQDSLLEHRSYRVHREERMFEKCTYGIVKESSKTSYLRFEQARDVLPEAIISMVKKIQSRQEYEKYLAELPESKKQKIFGLLGSHTSESK